MANYIKKIGIWGLLGYSTLWAQEESLPLEHPVKHLADKIHEMDGGMLTLAIASVFVAIALLLAVYALVSMTIGILNFENRKKGLPPISLFGNLKKRFITGNTLPIAEEERIQLSHNYDGIVELDNGMPPWLRAIFATTIVAAIAYLGFYYVLGLGKFQQQEYEEEIASAQVAMAEYQKKTANAINESNVILEKDAAALLAAKDLFAKNCKTCHGAQAEGGAGPNLTDPYWLHGGSVTEIFKTIKYGVPAKGMIAWQQKLSPKDIQGLVGYVLSLQGSNPTGAKAPQGEMASTSSTPPTDTTAADSIQKQVAP